jgi:predicted small secreted protein
MEIKEKMMNRKLLIPLMLTAVALFLTGCVTSGSEGLDWQIALRAKTRDVYTADDVSAASKALTEVSFEQKGVLRQYKALPLYVVIGNDALIGSAEASLELWNQGYDVTLTASDGYSVTFNTSEVAADAIFLAVQENGKHILPRIVGDVSTKYQVKDVVEIIAGLGADGNTDPYYLELNIQDEDMNFSIEELEASPFVVEGLGGYTTSAGTYNEHTYTGIRFADFISSFLPVRQDSMISVEAVDGYKMSYSGSDLLDESDGVWILAFKSDGEYIPLDPGPIRTVKIALNKGSVPNIDGHSSARMVQKVSFSDQSYRDFTLTMDGRIHVELDRATIQSGINCSAHKSTVTYYNKKADADEEYTGMPLFTLLAFVDDTDFQPHKQTDKSILSYDSEAALAGYRVKIIASDGYAVTLDSRELHNNTDVILAMYEGNGELDDADWPLKLVWDKDAEIVPEGIKAVRNVIAIELLF